MSSLPLEDQTALACHHNKSFSKDIPMMQFSWDSTSLGLLKTCPRKYYYTMIHGWNPKGSNIHLEFGIHYHSALEEFDKAKAEGLSHEDAARASLQYILNLGSYDEDGNWIPWDTDKDHKDYNLKNRATLIRATQWYIEHFKEDPCETVILANGKPAVELSFRMGIKAEAADGQEYMLSGHMDRLVQFGNEYFVMDRKTTKSGLTDYFFAQFNPNNQMSLYTTAGNVALSKPVKGVIIDAAQLAVGFARFARQFSNRSKGLINEWLQDTIQWMRTAERYAQDEHFPQNDTACDKFGGCPFRGICGADPSIREKYLKTDFEKRIWDPLESRNAD